MSIKDLEKQRSQYAYGCVENAVKEFDDKKQKEYKSYVRKLPMMILNNGLAPTIAFVYSKKEINNEGKNAYYLIYDDIDSWLQKREIKKDKKEELVKFLIDRDSSEYRMITNEILALFSWLKRFAEGMIEDKKEDKPDGEKKE